MTGSHLPPPSVTRHLEKFDVFSSKSSFGHLYKSEFLEKENKTRWGDFEAFFSVSQVISVRRPWEHMKKSARWPCDIYLLDHNPMIHTRHHYRVPGDIHLHHHCHTHHLHSHCGLLCPCPMTHRQHFPVSTFHHWPHLRQWAQTP